MSKKNIFVTGGAGVIGQQLVPLLIANGHSVTVGDLKPRPESFGSEIDYWRLDLNNLGQSQFDSAEFHVVFNLAAAFERTFETPEFWSNSFDNNVKLSHYIMSLVANSKSVERVVYASSYLVYDSSQYIFANDSNAPVRLRPGKPIWSRNLIGASKLYHEFELEFMARQPSRNYSIAVARIYRGYGIGSRDVVSRWVRSALSGQPLKAYNTLGRFDYIYCKDSAMALYKIAMDSAREGVVDVGTGRSEQVESILTVLRDEFPNLKVEYLENLGPFEASEADTTTLKDWISWTPQYTLRSAIPEIIEYERRKP